MSTASAFNAPLQGSYSFERNEAVSVPVPGIESNRVVFISELLERVAELSKRVVRLEAAHDRVSSENARHRRTLASRRQERHPLDRTENQHHDSLLLPDEEDLLSLHNEGAESELVDAALATADADRACHAD